MTLLSSDGEGLEAGTYYMAVRPFKYTGKLLLTMRHKDGKVYIAERNVTDFSVKRGEILPLKINPVWTADDGVQLHTGRDGDRFFPKTSEETSSVQKSEDVKFMGVPAIRWELTSEARWSGILNVEGSGYIDIKPYSDGNYAIEYYVKCEDSALDAGNKYDELFWNMIENDKYYPVYRCTGGNKFAESMENAVDAPFWEKGSGQRFFTRNSAHSLSGASAERESYLPMYMQQYYDTDLEKLLIYNGSDWVDVMGEVAGPLKPEFDRALIPQPVFDAEPGYVELYWKAWEQAYDHVKWQKGLVQPLYMDEGLWDDTIWIWDSEFMVMFCKYAPKLFPGIQTLDNFYYTMLEDKGSSLRIQHPDNPPFFAWVENDYYKLTGDKTHITDLLENKRFLQRAESLLDQGRSDKPSGEQAFPAALLGIVPESLPRTETSV